MGNSEDTTPLMSWYTKLYPLHACEQCGLEHTSIPTIINRKGTVLIPLEIIGTAHGTYNGPKPYATPAYIHGLYLGIPGAGQHLFTGMISCN